MPDVRIPVRLPFAESPRAGQALQPAIARDRVRYVGEPVAVVLATDPWTAEDAAELVALELDPLEPVADPVTAAERPALHPDLGGNVVDTVPVRHGDPDPLFADAAVVVRDRLVVHRHTGMPLETRGLVAEWDAGAERLTVWGAAKVKHFNRAALAQMLDLDVAQLRFVEVNVGGGFGVRGEFYPEDLLIPFAARRLGRPVKWIEDRPEHLVAANHAREQVHEIEVAADADGCLLAFRDRCWCDQGAYVRTQGLLPALLPALQLAGPYAWQAFAVEANAVVTSRTPAGTARAPGVTEATFVRERMVDRVAAELNVDPAELRRRNLVAPDAMPFVFDLAPAEPLVYESGDFPAFLDRLLERAGYAELRAEQRAGDPAARERLGVGVATFVEMGAVGPFERARIVPSGGRLVVHVGVASVGQGVGTALAQIAADALGVRIEQVDVRHHDTDEHPDGFGAFASRSTTMAGNAVALAADDLRAKAAEALGVPAEGIDLGARIEELERLGVAGGATYEKEHPSFSFGAALAVVAVDAELGRVRVLRHFVALDAGRAVNPALLRDQLAGGSVQGVGGALYEHLAYDADALPLTRSFDEYLLPTALDAPDVDVLVLEHPTPSNPLGLKGGGEAGVAGAPAAVANAVADALGTQEVRELPLDLARVRALARVGSAA